MASLPSLPTFAGMRRTKPKPSKSPSDTAATIRLTADDEHATKLNLAHRLRAQDQARKTTSVPPPPKR
ncbi:MAG: hypothetical protein JWQ18_1198 [Conexibacter sp.]|nr:hypothetical protein [Conexibacter sp.]